jgi:hypothetical protein
MRLPVDRGNFVVHDDVLSGTEHVDTRSTVRNALGEQNASL